MPENAAYKPMEMGPGMEAEFFGGVTAVVKVLR